LSVRSFITWDKRVGFNRCALPLAPEASLSPRTPEANESIRAESRARIMEHALALFAYQGFDRTRVREIADSAGISQGLIYNYFSSKDELLHALFERSMGDVRESFAEAERAPRGQRSVALVRAAFEVLRRNERFWRVSYGVRLQAAVLAGLGEALQQWTTGVHRTLEGYLREDGFEEPELEAAILFALIDGVSQHYVLDPARYPLDAVAERIGARYSSVPGPR
jgi:AcrR family transcriptional regulator